MSSIINNKILKFAVNFKDFFLKKEEALRVAGFAEDKSYSIRNNGLIYSGFQITSDIDLQAVVKAVPEQSNIQIIVRRKDGEKKRFMIISFPSESSVVSWNLLDCFMAEKKVKEYLEAFNRSSNEAYNLILKVVDGVRGVGVNLFKCGGESIIFDIVGGVDSQDGKFVAKEDVSSNGAWLKIGEKVGLVLDISGFSGLEGLDLLANENSYLVSTVRKVGDYEARKVLGNTIGSKVFSEKIKDGKGDEKVIKEMRPYAFSHTMFFFDESVSSLEKWIARYKTYLLANKITFQEPILTLKQTFISSLPGQGDLYQNPLYLDENEITYALKHFQGIV
jgi:hypothetical protein